VPRRQWLQEFQPKVSQFGPAIAWLTKIAGISGDRLAHIFKTSATNIRVLSYRHRNEVRLGADQQNLMGENAPPLIYTQTPRHRREIQAELFENKLNLSRAEYLDNEIRTHFDFYSRKYRFLDGAKYLMRLRSQLGRPGDLQLVRLLIRLAWKTAWFLVHSGWTAPAYREAETAIRLARDGFRETRKKELLYEVAEAAQIASNAALISHHPLLALKQLELTRQALEVVQGNYGWEYYKQKATVYFQLRGYDDIAKKNYDEAMNAIQRLDGATSPTQINMLGTMTQNFMDADYDGALDLVSEAVRDFGPVSLEYCMAVNWAAACGLVVDDCAVNLRALDLLESHREVTKKFGHQITISDLLLVTLELGIPSSLRSHWIRRALYENAFRAK
jgi:hypothetical protein